MAHKHELHKLTMTRILSQAPGLFYLSICLPGMLSNIYTCIFHLLPLFFLLSNLSQILDVAFLLSVIIFTEIHSVCNDLIGKQNKSGVLKHDFIPIKHIVLFMGRQ